MKEAASGSLTLSGPSWPRKKTGGGWRALGDQPRQRKEDPDFHLGLCSVMFLRHRGAIMAVPATTTGTGEFAKKFGCEIIEVVSQGGDIRRRPLP